MASTNEFARKIFNSPTYAEPWLVASANEILQPDNWYFNMFRILTIGRQLNLSLIRVFLTGKVHVDYRKILNTLFTRNALR